MRGMLIAPMPDSKTSTSDTPARRRRNGPGRSEQERPPPVTGFPLHPVQDEACRRGQSSGSILGPKRALSILKLLPNQVRLTGLVH